LLFNQFLGEEGLFQEMKFLAMVAQLLALFVGVVYGAILGKGEETPLSILVDTLWWKNNRGRGLDRILKVGQKSGLADLNIQNEQGWSPLHFSVEYNAPKVTEQLLKGGADVDLQENDGWTPLHFAAFHGNVEVAELLLKFNADASAWTSDGRMPYALAVMKGFTTIAQTLSRQAYEMAVEKSDVIKMLRIMEDFPTEFPVNVQIKNGQTPLHLAVEREDAASVSTLLALGAAPGYADSRTGLTPLHHAVSLGNAEIVQMLLTTSTQMNNEGLSSAAARVDSMSNEGISPIALAEMLVMESATGTADQRLESMATAKGGNSAEISLGSRKQVLELLQRFAGLPTEEDMRFLAEEEKKKKAEKAAASATQYLKSFLNP